MPEKVKSKQSLMPPFWLVSTNYLNGHADVYKQTGFAGILKKIDTNRARPQKHDQGSPNEAMTAYLCCYGPPAAKEKARPKPGFFSALRGRRKGRRQIDIIPDLPDDCQ